MKINPSDPTPYFNRALMYYKQKINKNEALKDLDNALAIDDKYAKAYGLKGALYEEMGRIEEAK